MNTSVSALFAASTAPTAPTVLPLEISELSYEAGGLRILDRISLTFAAGPRSVVLGPNGAGKSVLLRVCHGLLQPTSGRIRWHGPAAAARWRQAMVFQRPVMLRRSAADNVRYALRLRRVPRTECGVRTAAALERTGLAHLAQTPARVLSIGEQQRLALARAWVLAPEVLFLDEPTANLDPAATRAVEDIIRAIDRGGTKIIMTTHDLGQARRLAHEVAFLHRGRVVEDTSAAMFFEAPESREAADFLAGKLPW